MVQRIGREKSMTDVRGKTALAPVASLPAAPIPRRPFSSGKGRISCDIFAIGGGFE
jgi:hypothetical protein